MITLTADEVQYIYDTLTKNINEERTLEERVLSLELSRIRDEYSVPEERAAAIAEFIISKRIFPERNTSVGLLALLTMLELNRIKLSYTQSELSILGNSVQAGTYQHDDICQWILDHKLARQP